MTPTKYGTRSSKSKNRRHFFRWPKEPGKGVGTCKYCDVRMKLAPVGNRGGLDRVYSKTGKKWSPGEPACHTREAVVAAKSPRQAKNGSKAKRGSRTQKRNDRKAHAAAAKRHAGLAKKRAPKRAPRTRKPKEAAQPSAHPEAAAELAEAGE